MKAAKYHLKRVMQNELFTIEHFSTLIVQVECCMNSRPISPMSADPRDLEPLTPGHFLTSTHLSAIPEPDLTDQTSSRLNMYQRLTQKLQVFWKRWSRDYISQLQQRGKWRSSCDNQIQPGQLVICKDDNLPPLKWQLARVLQVHHGDDGQIRVLRLRTEHGETTRSIHRVCILPTDK